MTGLSLSSLPVILRSGRRPRLEGRTPTQPAWFEAPRIRAPHLTMTKSGDL
jgi:hypothetical protein